MQQRAETLDDALIRGLLELRAERAHLHKIRAVPGAGAVRWWGRGALSCYFGSKSQQAFWRQTSHHLCLHCRFFSHFTSFLGTFFFWRSQNARWVFSSQTRHHLCLQCRCCSLLTSFFSSINSCVHSAHYQNCLSTTCTCSETYFKLSQAYDTHELAFMGDIPTCVVSQRACN